MKPLDIVYEHLGVGDARDVRLDEHGLELGFKTYVAWSDKRLQVVDRPLAVKLRVDGVAWAGEIARDPCAVA